MKSNSHLFFGNKPLVFQALALCKLVLMKYSMLFECLLFLSIFLVKHSYYLNFVIAQDYRFQARLQVSMHNFQKSRNLLFKSCHIARLSDLKIYLKTS